VASNNPTSAYFESLIKSATPRVERLAKGRRKVGFTDPSMPAPVLTLEKLDAMPAVPDAGPVVGHQRLAKSLMNILNGGETSIERLAFEVDPGQVGSNQGLWQQKLRGIPDSILKRISIQDSLVASIVNTRGNHIGSFGRPRRDRHGVGFGIVPLASVEDELSPDEQKALDAEIKRATALLKSCGHTKGWSDQEQMTFSQYLTVSTKNAVVLGRVATEIIWVYNVHTGRREFHSFRPIDAGTIYKAVPMNHMAVELRETASRLLERIKRKKLEHEPDDAVAAEDIAWIQVLEGQPRQSFTAEECVVYNFYPVADVEFRGYPLSPLDTVIAAVTTHINITTHNKLYFQSGRASRGILIIKSDDVDDSMINDIRQQFNAAINSVQNSWRVPVLGVGVDEGIEWVSTDASQRDMEFQYLSDMTARIILSAFQMSPEELPGYAHLCLHPTTQVLLPTGLTSLEDILAGKDAADGFSVWTGKDFVRARAFKTGDKTLSITTTSNGVTVKSSPDHLFRVVNEDGDLEWKKQKDLILGDVVLVNRKPVPGSVDAIPVYNGRTLTPDMMEVLGWLTGDGSIAVKKGQASFELYYNQEKEMQILDRHMATLNAFGLSPRVRVRRRTELQIEKQKKLFGFKSVAAERTSVALYDTDFCKWLLENGFSPSSSEKTIPQFLSAVPVEHRAAFLRGFFSADGSIDALQTPSIAIAANSTREQTKQLLLSLGIRTRFCEGTSRQSFARQPDGGFLPVRQKAPSKLIIKDKDIFFKHIGFLQPHKQPDMQKIERSARRWDRVSAKVARALCRDWLASGKVIGHEARDRVRHALADSNTPYRQLSSVASIAEEFGLELPSWLSDYYQESVVALEGTEEVVSMIDIEVFDHEHAFVANGVVVHNSRGTNNQALSESNQEYLMIAHRDVGLRPLLLAWQDFINANLLPLVAPNLVGKCEIQLMGLDAETAEKESIRLQQDAPLHMTYNQVLNKVEKKEIPAELGGDFPFNAQWQAIVDKYLTVGQIKEFFFGVKAASKDQGLAYVRDPFWFQWQQLQMQVQQQQMMQQQAAQQPPPSGGGGGGDGPEPGKREAQQAEASQQAATAESSQQQSQQASEQAGADLSRGIDQAAEMLKSEAALTPSKRKLLAKHRAIVDRFQKTWEDDSRAALAEIGRALSADEDIGE
jgi:hypothetical protein